MRTGVPGVWEEVAQRIKEQTAELEGGKDGEKEKIAKVVGVEKGRLVGKKPVLKVEERIKRQTTRVVRR